MKQKVKKQSGIAGGRFREVLRNFSDDQLKGIGAVAMAYNDAECRIHELFAYALRYRGHFRIVSSRINGLDGTVEILRAVTKNLVRLEQDKKQLQDDVQKAFNACLDSFLEIKRHRDAVIHANIFDESSGIGLQFGRRASMTEVQLTVANLNWLTKYCVSIGEELRSWIAMFEVFANAEDGVSSTSQLSLEEAAQAALSFAQERQSHRKILQPKPTLPD